jgi:predicted SprT family Zn-dependent metalloprotease
MVQELGFADYNNDKIIIAENVSESKKEEIFCHELTHWVLFKMGSKLESDEDFVCMFGSLLNQAIKSVE